MLRPEAESVSGSQYGHPSDLCFQKNPCFPSNLCISLQTFVPHPHLPGKEECVYRIFIDFKLEEMLIKVVKQISLERSA